MPIARPRRLTWCSSAPGSCSGGFVGLLSVTVAGIPLTLTASGGALIMGLVFGWLRSAYPFFGRIPEPAIWIFDTVGLCIFIGITSKPERGSSASSPDCRNPASA